MTRTNDLGNEERRSASGDATSRRTCNGKKKLNRSAPLFSVRVGKPVADKEKDSAEHCTKKSGGNGVEKRGNMRSDVEKAREVLPCEHGAPDEYLSVMHDRIPAMCEDSSDKDISGTVRLKQNKNQSGDGKNNGLPSVDHSCGDDGCTKLPSVGKNVTSSPDKHSCYSPQSLEKEALQIHPESESFVPDDAKLVHQDTGENSDSGNRDQLDEQSSDDTTINHEKKFDVGGHTDVAELSVASSNAPKGNCCEEKVVNSIDDSKLKPNLELSKLIDRIHSKLSDLKTMEETAKDVDETESIESERTDGDSGSETSGESESSDESESDVDRSQRSHGDDDKDGTDGDLRVGAQDEGSSVSGIRQPSDVWSKMTTLGAETVMTRPSGDLDCPSGDLDCPSGDLDCPVTSAPPSDEHHGRDSDGIPLNDHASHAGSLQEDCDEKSGREEKTQLPVEGDGMMVISVKTVASGATSSEVEMKELMTEPVIYSWSESSVKATPGSPANMADKSREGVELRGGDSAYSVFEKPAPLTKKRAAAFASNELDRYLSKHSELQQITKGGRTETPRKASDLSDKEVVHIDGITFTSFRMMGMLRRHVALEKETVRHIDTATMLQQKWGSKVEQKWGSKVEQKWGSTGEPAQPQPSVETALPPANAPLTTQKTDDIRKIKGWKKRLLSTDDNTAAGVEVTVSCKSEKLHWRSQEKLIKMLSGNQLKEMGLKLKQKRRRHTPYTQSKRHASPSGAGNLEPDAKTTPQTTKECYSGLLNGSPSSISKFHAMLDRKNLCIGLSSKFCDKIATSQSFRIVDNQLMAGTTEGDESVTSPRTDSESSETLPQGLRVLEAVVLTRAMALEAVSSLQQPPRAPCKKPGCRYSCVCHLCDVMSADDCDTSNLGEANVKTCNEEYCRLGCICDTVDSSPGGSKGHQPTDCGVLDTSVESWFVGGVYPSDTPNASPVERNPTASKDCRKRHMTSECNQGAKKRRPSAGDTPSVPEGFSQELAALLRPDVATGGAAKTDNREAVTSVRKCSRLKDKCSIGMVDRLKSLIFFDTASWLQDDKPGPRKQKKLRQIRKLEEQKQHAKINGSSASHQEVVIVDLSSDDDAETAANNLPCRKQQQNRKVETNDRVSTNVAISRSSRSTISKTTPKCSPAIQRSPPIFNTQMVVLERKQANAFGSIPSDKSPSSNIPHLLEIESDCNWQNGRFKILSEIARLADSCSSYPQATTFRVGRYVIRVLDKPRLPTNIPPHLQKSLNAKQMFAIHVRIIDAMGGDDSNQLGISGLGRLKVSLSGHVVTNKHNVSVEPSEPINQGQVVGVTTKEDKADEVIAIDDHLNILVENSPKHTDCDLGFDESRLENMPTSRSAQVEQARNALAVAREALSVELAKVKRERDESSDASSTGCASPVVKHEPSETIEDVSVVGGSLLVRPAPTLVPAPHVTVVPVAVVQNVAHAALATARVSDSPGVMGCHDDSPSSMGCHEDLPSATSCRDDTGVPRCHDNGGVPSCHDDGGVTEDAGIADSSLDDLLLTDDTSSLDDLNGTATTSPEDSCSSSGKSEVDVELCDNASNHGDDIMKTLMWHSYHKKTEFKMESADNGIQIVKKNVTKVTNCVHNDSVFRSVPEAIADRGETQQPIEDIVLQHGRLLERHNKLERHRRGQLASKFEKLRKVIHPIDIPGQKLSKQAILQMAVKTVHKVLKMHRHSIRQREVEMQRQTKLLTQLRQLKGGMETSEGNRTSQKVAQLDHCQKVAPLEDSQPDDKDMARQDVSSEVFDVSSDSNCDVDVCDGVS